jgi:hypothetical protein
LLRKKEFPVILGAADAQLILSISILEFPSMKINMMKTHEREQYENTQRNP